MKRKIKYHLLAAALLASLWMHGCTRQEPVVEVALVLKTTVETAEFWGQVMSGVNAAAEEFGVDLTITGASAETAVDEQIDLVEDVIQAKPDVMILVASDFNRLISVTEEAVEAGIQVVTMDSDVNTEARACYVASNNYRIGSNLGKQLLDAVPAGRVAILSHSSVASSGIERAQGALDAMQDSGQIEVLGVFDCENKMGRAREITEELLLQYPDLDAFVCTNEVCNRAVATCLVEKGLAGQIIIIGCDNSQPQIQYLEQNAIQGIVIQRPFNMGYEAVAQAVKVARNEPVDNFVEISCVNITRDNMYNSENQKLLFPF